MNCSGAELVQSLFTEMAASAVCSSQLECDLKDCKPLLVRHIQDFTVWANVDLAELSSGVLDERICTF